MRIEGRTSAHCVKVDDKVGGGWLSVLMKASLSKSTLGSHFPGDPLACPLELPLLQFVSKDLLTAVVAAVVQHCLTDYLASMMASTDRTESLPAVFRTLQYCSSRVRCL